MISLILLNYLIKDEAILSPYYQKWYTCWLRAHRGYETISLILLNYLIKDEAILSPYYQKWYTCWLRVHIGYET